MPFKLNILGCGSATPTLRHMPSCQVVEHGGMLCMIDCGEGAQLQMRRQGLSFSRLRHIFISHIHGDHFLGLPGLLSTLSLSQATGPVHVYIHPEGAALLEQMMRLLVHEPTYRLELHPIEPRKQLVLDEKGFTVETFALCHRVPTCGFIFREKPKQRHLRGDMLEFYDVPQYRRAALKDGADFTTADGRVIPNAWLTADPDPSSSYAYCSDTISNDGVADSVAGVHTIYHDATYADDNVDKAAQRGHSTARQAAQTALRAGAKQLVIGHYSKIYTGQEDILLDQARQVFPNTIAANEGMVISI